MIHGCRQDVRRVVGMCLFCVLLYRGVQCARFLVMLVNALQIRFELVWYRLMVDAHLEVPACEETIKMNCEMRLRSVKDTYLKFCGPLS